MGELEDGATSPLREDLNQTKAVQLGVSHSKVAQQGRPLTLELIAARNLLGGSTEVSIQALQHVHLDGERLTSIPIEVARELRSVVRLHLQHNTLDNLANFASMRQLRFLTLAHNQISEVSGLGELKKLTALDLSHNLLKRLDPKELPVGLQMIQLQGNPLGIEPALFFTELARRLPDLNRIDGNSVPMNRIFTAANLLPMSASEGSDGFTNELVEAALVELKLEGKGSKPPLVTLGRPPVRCGSSGALEKQPSIGKLSNKGGLEDGLSPIRVTPAVSRQASGSMGHSPSEAQEVLARVREALPILREAADIGINPDVGDNLDIKARSRSSEAITAFRRMRSDDTPAKHRTSSVPTSTEAARRTTSVGSSQASTGGHSQSFPLAHPPPDFKTNPQEFQTCLSGAIATLVGSRTAPGGGSAFRTPPVSSVWHQTQQHRQQVLDSLFAKRAIDGQLATQPSSSSSEGAAQQRYLRRQDSTISKGRRKTGSTINEDILQNLQLRDRPRAEGLSEAMQGPPVLPPADQLAALSRDVSERAAAERARMSLRRGICEMLDAAQKRRELEPAQEAAFISELGKLKQMSALQELLSLRDTHMSPQPQVLATILGSHSRLGSITDRLEKVLRDTLSEGVQRSGSDSNAPKAAGQAESHRHKLASPFEAPQPETGTQGPDFGESVQKLHSPFESSSPNKAQAPRRSLPVPRQASSSSSSSSGTEGSRASVTSRPPPKAQMPPRIPEGRSAPFAVEQRPAGSGPNRRRGPPPEPSSPGSDGEFDPHPPLNRQSARPIFGGIAKPVRGPSGQLELPVSPVPTVAGMASGRMASGKLSHAPGRAPSLKTPSAPAGPSFSNAYGQSSASGSEKDAQRPPLGATSPHRNAPPSMSRAQSSLLENPVKSQRDSERRQALVEAAEREAKFQAELWARFSGGAGNAAKVMQSSGSASSAISPFSNAPPDDQQFTSPFSTFGAASPSSQQKPRDPDDRIGLGQPGGTRGKSWQQGDAGVSPFARTWLPSIPRPAAHTGHPNPEVGQSAPPLPATAIEERMSAVDAMSRHHIEAASAPTSLEVCKALKDAVKAHKEQVSSEEAVSGGGIDKQTEGGPFRQMSSASSLNSVTPFNAPALQAAPASGKSPDFGRTVESQKQKEGRPDAVSSSFSPRAQDATAGGRSAAESAAQRRPDTAERESPALRRVTFAVDETSREKA